jgi:tetratricopeptide (TPR) repeat protein
MRGHVVLVTAIALLISGSFSWAQQLPDDASRRQALELYRAGQEHMSAERFDKAAESFTAAIGKDPLLSVAHYQLGQAYMSLQRYASAVQAYQGAIESMKSLHALEQTNQFEVDKRRQETIRELRSELNGSGQKLDPLKRTKLEQRVSELEHERTSLGRPFQAPAFVLLAMGSAHFRNGDRDAAAAEWQAAVTVDPKLGEAHNNLAVLHMMNGRRSDAENAVMLAEKAGFKVNPQLKADIGKLPR